MLDCNAASENPDLRARSIRRISLANAGTPGRADCFGGSLMRWLLPFGFLLLALVPLSAASQAMSNLHVVCAERFSPYMKVRQFLHITLREDQPKSAAELEEEFYNPQGIREVVGLVSHYEFLRLQPDDKLDSVVVDPSLANDDSFKVDFQNLLDQMTDENRRGERMLIYTHIGLGSMSYTGSYVSENGEPLNEDTGWISFPYKGSGDEAGTEFPVKFAKSGLSAMGGTQRFSIFICSRPFFSDISLR